MKVGRRKFHRLVGESVRVKVDKCLGVGLQAGK